MPLRRMLDTFDDDTGRTGTVTLERASPSRAAS